MDISTIILLALIFIVVFVPYYIYSTYNKLIATRTLTEESFSGMDVVLNLRHDLIPNLIETVKGYMKHEASVLEKITEWRARAQGAKSSDERIQAETGLSSSLAQIYAVTENYPDLKADTHFMELTKQLKDVEGQIQLARRYYNATVRDFNLLINLFPSNLVAKHFNFTPKEFFEVDNDDNRANPKVSF